MQLPAQQRTVKSRWYNRTMARKARVYRTEAIILRRMNLGEADRLLTLYTLTEGKVRAIAKGVRRPGSRKAGHLEPFTRAEVLLARGRSLDIITQAEAIELHRELQRDLETLGAAAYAVELLDRFTVDQGPHPELYRLLREILERLSAGSAQEALMRVYELRLLELAGFRPELFQCLGCGEQIRARDQFFSSHIGGVLCPDCGRSDALAAPISMPALRVLRHYQRSTTDRALQPEVRLPVLREAEARLEEYITYILERRLNVPAFIREVRESGKVARQLTERD